jgi:hypothetical protein
VPVGIWNTFFDPGTSRVLRQGIDLSRLVAVESIERRGVPRAHYEHQFGFFGLLDRHLRHSSYDTASASRPSAHMLKRR